MSSPEALAAPEAPRLVLRGVSKRFGRVRALRAVDLVVEPGERVALLGPNGAGKSTLLRLVAGLLRATQGAVFTTAAAEPEASVSAGAARRSRDALRRALGYVSHHTMLHDALTPRENLVFTGRLHGLVEPGRRAATLLSELGLGAHADRPVGGLSRGLQQRVSVARALVPHPSLLLFDEPYTGLDLEAAANLERLLAALGTSRRTVLLVTHDVARGLATSDRAVVLVDGRVVLDRAVRSADEREDFTRDYAACFATAEAGP